jgi:hypothetical protein
MCSILYLYSARNETGEGGGGGGGVRNHNSKKVFINNTI